MCAARGLELAGGVGERTYRTLTAVDVGLARRDVMRLAAGSPIPARHTAPGYGLVPALWYARSTAGARVGNDSMYSIALL